jgi:putative membrane protein
MDAMSLLTQTIVNAIALFILDSLLAGVTVVSGGSGQPGGLVARVIVFLILGLVLALVNSVIKPVLKVLALPLYILTLGLFALVVNGLILLLVSRLTSALGFGLEIASFGTAVWAGLVLSILTSLVAIPFRNK